ncbi:zinc-binding dehydrogenase [Brachybacterium avium]|uniref:zinc-binding dehydrogenase n=1 Tax=Brachybacterium avium TaxID=2017485 RepID=UPI001C450E31|nr:zinc-binding dehydrogenase [Brachybacterium avium]
MSELPVPRPRPGQVLLAVRASSLDPVDALVRSGAFPTQTPFPFVLGRDAVGTVIDAGAGAEDLLGRRMATSSLGHDGRQGAWAPAAVVPRERLYPVPAEVEDAVLAAALHPASTAHLALHRHGHLVAGETVLVGGGAGNVGSALVAEAARCGARVVATARRRDAARVRALGAAGTVTTVDHTDPGAADQLRELLGGRADLVVDTSGRLDPELLADLMAVRGRIVVIAAPPNPPRIPLARLYTRDVSLHGFVISRATVEELADAARGTVRLLQETPWRPRITDTVGLDAARSLHERLDAGGIEGRVVMRIRA